MSRISGKVNLDGLISYQNLVHQLAPLDVVLKSLKYHEPDWPSCDSQSRIIQNIRINGEYNRPVKYDQALMKILVQDIEASDTASDQQQEMEDSFTETYMALCCAHSDHLDSGYCIYNAIYLDRMMPMHIYRSHNEVGTRPWTAGIYLAELVQHIGSKGLWKEKKILELGSGMGITGLLLALGLPSALQPSHVCLTDFASSVMELLEENTKLCLNLYSGETCSIAIKQCDWSSTADVDEIMHSRYDCILAADCTYSPDLNTHLAQLFNLYLSQTHAKHNEVNLTDQMNLADILNNSSPCVIIVCTKRNADTFQHFLQELASCSHCRWIDLTSSAREIASGGYYYCDREELHLLKVIGIIPR